MMRRLYKWIWLAVLLCPLQAQAQFTKLQNWCMDGNVSVKIPGTQGSGNQKFQQSFPNCNVRVTDAGTGTLSSIYANSTGTAKGNPFTAASNGLWFFYGVAGKHYDVTFSGGGISPSFTIGDLVAPGVLDCTSYPGNSASQRIAACIAALPATGGTADATGFTGSQVWNTDPFTGVTKPVDFLCGATTFVVSVNTSVPRNVAMVYGQGCVFSVNNNISLTTLGSRSASSDSVHFSGAGTTRRTAATTNPAVIIATQDNTNNFTVYDVDGSVINNSYTVATLTTNGTTAIGNNTLHFASTTGITTGMAAWNVTNPQTIPNGLITGVTSTTVVVTSNVANFTVGNGDTFVFFTNPTWFTDTVAYAVNHGYSLVSQSEAASGLADNCCVSVLRTWGPVSIPPSLFEYFNLSSVQVDIVGPNGIVFDATELGEFHMPFIQYHGAGAAVLWDAVGVTPVDHAAGTDISNFYFSGVVIQGGTGVVMRVDGTHGYFNHNLVQWQEVFGGHRTAEGGGCTSSNLVELTGPVNPILGNQFIGDMTHCSTGTNISIGTSATNIGNLYANQWKLGTVSTDGLGIHIYGNQNTIDAMVAGTGAGIKLESAASGNSLRVNINTAGVQVNNLSGVGNNSIQQKGAFVSGLTTTTAGTGIAARFEANALNDDVNIQFSDVVTNSAQVGMLGANLYSIVGGIKVFNLNGSGGIQLANANTNSTTLNFNAVGSDTNSQIIATHIGAGTTKPLEVFTDATKALTFNTSGGLVLGAVSPLALCCSTGQIGGVNFIAFSGNFSATSNNTANTAYIAVQSGGGATQLLSTHTGGASDLPMIFSVGAADPIKINNAADGVCVRVGSALRLMQVMAGAFVDGGACPF